MANRTVSVRLQAQVAGYMAGIRQAGIATRTLGKELDTLGAKSPQKLHNITMAAGLTGAALLALSGYAVKAAMDFDREMSGVSAVIDKASQKDMPALREAALAAGRATQYSATQAAQAEEELAKAGISTSDILHGALTGSLNLAAAGQMNLADAATISAQAMNIFGLKGSAVPHIADVLAASANKSAADMHDLGDALKQGGLIASQAGLSLEDTVGTLSAFADRALIGSDAGTSLKTMLQRLQAPSQQSAALMQKLGINVYDSSGKFVGITKVAGILQDKLGGLTQAQRDYALAQIFGSDATRAANVLYSLGAKGLQDYIQAVDDAGAAQATAAKKTDNLSGDLTRLRSAIESVAIEAGTGANGGLRILTQAITGLVNQFGRLPTPVQTSITVITGISGASLLAAAGLLKVRSTAKDALSALSEMGPTGAKAALGLGKVFKYLGAAGAIGAGVFILYEGLSALLSWSDKSAKPVQRNIDDLTQSLRDFAQWGQIVGEMARTFGTNLGKLTRDVELYSHGAQRATEIQRAYSESNIGAANVLEQLGKAQAQAKSDIASLDKAMANLVSQGGVTQAKIAFENLADASGVTLDMLPEYAKAAGAAKVASSGLAKGFGTATENAKTLARTLQDAIDAGQTLQDVFNQLNGGTLGWRDAQRQAEQQLADLTQALKDSNGSLSVHTEKGRHAAEMTDEMARKAAAAAQAKYIETGSISDANKVYDDYIGKLKDALLKAGIMPGKVDALVKSISKMPPMKLDTKSLDSALTKLDKIKNKVHNLPNGTIYVQVVGGKQILTQRWGGITQHAATGLLSQAGVYSAQSPARYAFAEPGTGGEAFIPRNGNYARSMSILQQAAAWYGATVTAGMGARGATASETIVSPDVRVFIGDQELKGMVRVEISEHDRALKRRVTAR